MLDVAIGIAMQTNKERLLLKEGERTWDSEFQMDNFSHHGALRFKFQFSFFCTNTVYTF
jgi:hypothetical protein